MNAWVRTEPKILRPFFGAEKAWKLLHNSAIVLELGGESRTEERIELGLDSMTSIAPVVFPQINGDALFEAFGDSVGAFSLVVTLRTPSMFRRELVSTHLLSDDIQMEVPIPEELLSDAKLGGLCEIGVSICLSEQVNLGSGWPTQLGGFVSQKTFVIGLDRSQSSFRILPLTQEVLTREQLPRGTFVYVEVEDLNEAYEDGQACATAYVAEGVLSAAARSKNKATLAALMQAEIIIEILLAKENGLPEASVVCEGSPLAAILNNLLPNRKLTLPQLQKLVQNPSRFRATVLDAVGVVGRLERI